uniref:Recep_L_domain domain-containing protein n=1 Tax=Rhabditophanes sp. KR3021 TaxID=114890 RepID=A0AC35TQM3_9BILA
MNQRIFILILPLLFTKVKCFQDCVIDLSKAEPVDLAFDKCKDISGLEFSYQNVYYYQYDFMEDTCSTIREITIYSDSLIISFNSMKKYRINEASYRPSCIPPNAKYLRDNLWIIPPTVEEIKSKSKLNTDQVEFLYHHLCQADMAVLYLSGEQNMNDIRYIYRRNLDEMDGFDYIKLNDKILKYNCIQLNATQIVRTRKIGQTCFDRVPVIVHNITMFSMDGIDLVYTSNTVDCSDVYLPPESMELKQNATEISDEECSSLIDNLALCGYIIVFICLFIMCMLFCCIERELKDTKSRGNSGLTSIRSTSVSFQNDERIVFENITV